MKAFCKAQYLIPIANVVWVLDMAERDRKAAFSAWGSRFEKLFDLQLSQVLYGKYWNQLDRLLVDLFERLNAIRYPMTIERYEFYESDRREQDLNKRWLEYAPPGSYELRRNGKVIKAVCNNRDWRFIGNHHFD